MERETQPGPGSIALLRRVDNRNREVHHSVPQQTLNLPGVIVRPSASDFRARRLTFH
jgi:hypothetical protein